MTRGRRVVVAGVAAVLLFLALALLALLRQGFSTHDDPSWVEAAVARTVRAWAVPADLRKERNPVALTPAVMAEARAHFADHCAGCHGNDGKGSDLGESMYPPAPDMTLETTQALSDGALFSIVENGVPLSGMPGFGSGTAASAYGSWTLVHFIRQLPKITAQDLAEMEKLNPKSPAQWRQIQEEETFLKEEPEETPPPTGSAHQH